MKMKMSAALGWLVAALLVAVALTLPAPASAEVTDCKVVTVEDRVGPDSGENGNNWATATIDRKLEVCATDKPDDGKWQYQATVTDTGTFVTLAGDSPGAGTEAKLSGGFTGKVQGGFEATFMAPAWTADSKLVAPDPKTPTGMWVVVAFPGADFTAGGSVVNWAWTYTTCDGKGETWVNAHDGNSGDITEKACPSPSPSPSQTTSSPSPSPSVTQSESPSPSPSTSSPAARFCEQYVYTGTNENLCSAFPENWDSVDCADVQYRVTLLDVNVDPWGLDANGAGVPGVGCESNPLKPGATATVTTSPASGEGGGGLPLTGGKPLAAGGLGVLIVAVGAALFVLARRRRDEEEAGPETA